MHPLQALIYRLLILPRLAADDGQTLAEYGILVAVIAIIVLVAALVFGASVSALFSTTAKGI